jgi:hypothetical protein
MPHLKCVTCKTRLYSPGGWADLNSDLCPGCGSLLEPVGELAEVVGFRLIKSRDSSADDGATSTHGRLADRVGDLIARRDAALAQARLDAERWVDDGGRFRGEAVPSALTGNELMNVPAASPAERHRCLCQHGFQVFGLGRHRRYYELADHGWERPLMGRVCPSCQRRLPGKNPLHAAGQQVVARSAGSNGLTGGSIGEAPDALWVAT